MKRSMVISIFLTVFMVFFVTAPVCMAAEEAAPTAGADISVLNKYIWRGYELSGHGAVIQPSATVSYKDISLNLWGNLDCNADGDSQFNETDMTFSYDTTLSDVSLGAGYIYYGLDGATDTQEIYLSAGFDTLLSPSVTIYRDIENYASTYINFGVSHAIELPEDMSLELAGSAGYYLSNTNNLTEPNSTKKYKAFHDGSISATFTVPLDKYITVSPMVAYSFPLSSKSDDFLKAANNAAGYSSNKSAFIYGGVTFSMAF